MTFSAKIFGSVKGVAEKYGWLFETELWADTRQLEQQVAANNRVVAAKFLFISEAQVYPIPPPLFLAASQNRSTCTPPNTSLAAQLRTITIDR